MITAYHLVIKDYYVVITDYSSVINDQYFLIYLFISFLVGHTLEYNDLVGNI